MTPEAALFNLMSSFGVPAYAATSVPDDAVMPYLTYELAVGYWGSGEVNVPVRLWDRTASEARMNSMVRSVAAGIPVGGVTVPCDGGMLWVKRGSPWAQSLTDEATTNVKCRYLNVDVEYLIVE